MSESEPSAQERSARPVRPEHGAFSALWVSSSVAGTGGVIKQRPEDFLVDELPAYAPSGAGEHIYILVQKRGIAHSQMIDVIARHFGVRRDRVGYAGQKDKHAITRQVISVHAPGKTAADYPMLEHESVSILWADQHANKLRPGHLKGNRFSIRIRNVNAMDVRLAQKTLSLLAKEGAPNRVGEQRFGMLENNHVIGRALVRGDFQEALDELLGPSGLRPDFNREARELYTKGLFREAIAQYPLQARTETRVLHQLSLGKDPRRALLSLDETTLRFYLSAFQSAAFNHVLDERIRAGTFRTLLEGDQAIKHENHALFLADAGVLADAGTQARLHALEISPSGPMWALSMARTSGEPARIDDAALAAQGVTHEQLEAFDRGFRHPLEGKRRPLRVPVIDPEIEGGVDEVGPYIRCAFELPRGSFATSVMREVIKPAPRVAWGGEGEAS